MEREPSPAGPGRSSPTALLGVEVLLRGRGAGGSGGIAAETAAGRKENLTARSLASELVY